MKHFSCYKISVWMNEKEPAISDVLSLLFSNQTQNKTLLSRQKKKKKQEK
jgi:hypothetical protein